MATEVHSSQEAFLSFRPEEHGAKHSKAKIGPAQQFFERQQALLDRKVQRASVRTATEAATAHEQAAEQARAIQQRKAALRRSLEKLALGDKPAYRTTHGARIDDASVPPASTAPPPPAQPASGDTSHAVSPSRQAEAPANASPPRSSPTDASADSLYRRQMAWRASVAEGHARLKSSLASRELEGCTFRPQLEGKRRASTDRGGGMIEARANGPLLSPRGDYRDLGLGLGQEHGADVGLRPGHVQWDRPATTELARGRRPSPSPVRATHRPGRGQPASATRAASRSVQGSARRRPGPVLAKLAPLPPLRHLPPLSPILHGLHEAEDTVSMALHRVSELLDELHEMGPGSAVTARGSPVEGTCSRGTPGRMEYPGLNIGMMQLQELGPDTLQY